MKWLLAIFAAFAITASAADISGNWKATAEGPNGAMERTFVFKVDGNKVTGESTSQMMGKSPISIEDFWTLRCEMSEKLRDKVAKLSKEQFGEVKHQSLEALRAYSTDTGMSFPAEVLVVSGSKRHSA